VDPKRPKLLFLVDDDAKLRKLLTILVALRLEGSAVRFEVTNSCASVAAEDLERIFDPFYRGKGSGSEGTGLGLAITRKIVLMHKGDIGAQNTPEGFQVWLWLPRHAGEQGYVWCLQ
jgi:signal transduction histidine kinase